MTAPVIDRELYESCQTDGRLKLSTGFIQRMYEEESFSNSERPAILQVVQFRILTGENQNISSATFSGRARLNDGVFTSTGVLFDTALMSQLQHDCIKGAPAGGEGGEIIAIRKAAIHKDASLNLRDGSKMKAIVVTDYCLLSRGHPQLGHDHQAHHGDKSVHQGYRPTTVVSTEWPEAAAFTGDSAPTPKRAKGSDGQPMGAIRAPPPQPSRNNSSMSYSRSETLTPIAMITPYINKFKICGVCTAKEEIRNIKGRSGDMKVFNFELTDKDGTTIRVCAFNEVAEQNFGLVRDGMAFYLSGGTIRMTNKQYNTTGHDYEITMRNDSELQVCEEEIKRPTIAMQIVPLDKIPGHMNSYIDVLAIVERIDPVTEFTSKAGRDCTKREVRIVDTSLTEVTVTLWGDQAKKFPEHAFNQVVAFKGVQPKEWQGGYSLSTSMSTRVILSPDLEQSVELCNWYANERQFAELKNISAGEGGIGGPASFARDLRLISTIQALRMGADAQVYLYVKAMITRMNPDNALYKACPAENCQKKVIDVDGEYRCEKCAKTTREFKWNYMLQFEITDLSGNVYVTAFSQVAQKLLGYDAKSLGDIKESSPEEYGDAFQRAHFKYHNFRLRAKYESYNEESRLRLTVQNVEDVNLPVYIGCLKDCMEKMHALDI